jgi:phage-related protein
MAYTFTFIPSKAFVATSKPRVAVSQFGDGYSQRVGLGINRLTKEWSLVFKSRSITQSDQIIAFLEARAGTEGFLWQPPGDSTTYSVVCMDWSRTYDNHLSTTIQARFVQIFDVLI